MKKLITLICLIFSVHAFAQRSQKPWDNYPNYKEDFQKINQDRSNLEYLKTYFEKTNQNQKVTLKDKPKQTKGVDGISFINGINLAWIEYGRDVGVDPFFSSNQYHPDLDKFAEVMDFVKQQGGNVVRWWYHTNGSTNPVFDSDQKVTQNPLFFHEDVKKILDLAQEKGLKVQICLWSFDMLKDQWGVDAFANKKLLTQDTYTRAYIDNALLPLVNYIGNHSALFAWEIFNEPEGMTNEYASHWPGFKEKVTMQDIQRFVNKTAGAIRRAQPNVKITNGALGFLTNVEDSSKGFWNAYSDANLIFQGNDDQGYLDFYNIHYYNWARSKGSPFHNDYDANKIDKQAIIGEYYPDNLFFNQQGGDSDHNLNTIPAVDLGTTLVDRKWAGSLVWSWTDRSSANERNRMATIIKNVSDHSDHEIIEEVAFNNASDVIQSQISYTFNIDYSAAEDREIVVEFWAPDRWLGENTSRVTKGEGTQSITVTLSNPPTPGSGFFYKAYIRPVGTTWQEAIHRVEYRDVLVIDAINDEVAFVNPLLSLAPQNSYEFIIDYTATTDREIVVEFWASDRWLGEKVEQVSSGTGRKNVIVSLESIPEQGDGYFYKAYIRPVGTTWQEAIYRVEFTGVTVGPLQLIEDGTYYIVSPISNQRLISRWWENYNARMYAARDGNNQKWTLKHLGDNVYTIQDEAYNRYLEVRDAGCNNRANVMSWTSANDDHQKWKIVAVDDGYFVFKPMHCLEKALDREGGFNNANVQLWSFDSSNFNQKWKIVPSSDSKIKEGISGTDKLEENLKLYPNPATEYVNISGIKKGDKIIISDLLGKVVKTSIANQEEERISIIDLEAGYYNIMISGRPNKILIKG
ncbi:RICIN domain-containing protein [Aquimarina gracilis]|uniref:RICIN domain-containing protein n=1 Tax=Aquimarina gracilis TaxID=874422 RepID=A0ABU6A291_9FLAO|nr:RICIN domain-containing protein [Aquimarina gracilis]MEB3348294.1 RICIN domain-containing protein [Aquimarina gracilis]